MTTKRGRRTQAERRAETRRRLIQATIRCLCDDGYSETSTTKIARRAKVSRGALQHHFKTRNDLILAVTEYVGHELEQAFTPSKSRGAGIGARVDRICNAYWHVCRSDAYIAQIQTWIGSRSEPPLNRRIERLMGRMLSAQDRLWQATFADLGIPRSRLIALRRLTLAAIRGLALRMVYRTGRVTWTREFALLRSMITDALARREP